MPRPSRHDRGGPLPSLSTRQDKSLCHIMAVFLRDRISSLQQKIKSRVRDRTKKQPNNMAISWLTDIPFEIRTNLSISFHNHRHSSISSQSDLSRWHKKGTRNTRARIKSVRCQQTNFTGSIICILAARSYKSES